MTPAAPLSALRTAGVALVPIGEGTLRVQGERAVVDSWLPEIRQAKPELLRLLAVNSPSQHRRWLVTLPGGAALEVDVLPPGNLPEVLAAYPPGALAEPLRGDQEPTAGTPPPAAAPTPPRLEREAKGGQADDTVAEVAPGVRAMVSDKTAPLSRDDQAAIEEAIEERAAIREFDGGEDRATAEREARSAMRVYRYRITDKPNSWLILICPGCDLEEARQSVIGKFGHERVLEVVEYRPTPRAVA